MNAGFPIQLFLFCNPVFFEAGLDMRKSSKGEPKFPGFWTKKEKTIACYMGYMGNPDWEDAGNECLARWISQVISLLNIWKNVFQFPLCISLHNSSSCGNVSFLTFPQSLCEKAIEVQSLALTQGLKSFSAISCNRWNFWCQVVSLVHALTRVCSAASPALPPQRSHCYLSAGAAWLHALQDAIPDNSPIQPFPDFINYTSKKVLCSYSCLIPPP